MLIPCPSSSPALHPKTGFNDGAATPWPRNMMGGAVPGGTYRPVEPLSAFAGLQTGGQWTLKAQDFWQTDAGMLGGFTLKLDSCSEGKREAKQHAPTSSPPSAEPTWILYVSTTPP
jgi:hypothetical protein